ncbi:hypothetical protein PBI_PIPP_41 [Gordonia phage Pipp]|nr:hypothetical protein PBI_PIPP_41 [Gordonia phage Pipp]
MPRDAAVELLSAVTDLVNITAYVHGLYREGDPDVKVEPKHPAVEGRHADPLMGSEHVEVVEPVRQPPRGFRRYPVVHTAVDDSGTHFFVDRSHLTTPSADDAGAHSVGGESGSGAPSTAPDPDEPVEIVALRALLDAGVISLSNEQAAVLTKYDTDHRAASLTDVERRLLRRLQQLVPRPDTESWGPRDPLPTAVTALHLLDALHDAVNEWMRAAH